MVAQGKCETVHSEPHDEVRKSMAFVFFSVRGFMGMKCLPDRASFNSCFILRHIFPEIDNEIAMTWVEMQLRGLDFHMGNAMADNYQEIGDEFDGLGHKRIPDLPYSLDFLVAASCVSVSSKAD
jgi:hypothetical protein